MSKKNDTWMPLYIGDYLADTSRLTTEQHGAYFLLLMDYWRNGPPLAEEDELATITKLSVAQWRKHAPKILPLFREDGGRLHQKRADEERQKAGLVSSKRSEAGKQGAAKRWGKSDGKGDGKTMANAMAGSLPNAWQNDGPSQSQSPTTTVDGVPPASGAGAHTREGDAPDLTGFTPTPAGAICRALKQAGLANVNPGHPRLLALIDAGATVGEFIALAPKAIAEGGEPFAYLLGAVEGERKRAARTAGQIHRGPLKAANRQEAVEAENKRVAADWLRQQEEADAGQ